MEHNHPSSSLQRLETSTGRIDANINEIKDYLQRSEKAVSQSKLPPTVSNHPGLKDDDISKSFFSVALLKRSQITQNWALIGLSDWIGAGRWWLLRVSCQCGHGLIFLSHSVIGSNGSPSENEVPTHGDGFSAWIPKPRQGILDIDRCRCTTSSAQLS
jgi:hypothetical protein